jgi:hypothetical protein
MTDEDGKHVGAEEMIEDLEAPVAAQAEVAGGADHASPETVRSVRPHVRDILETSPSFTTLAPPPPPK